VTGKQLHTIVAGAIALILIGGGILFLNYKAGKIGNGVVVETPEKEESKIEESTSIPIFEGVPKFQGQDEKNKIKKAQTVSDCAEFPDMLESCTPYKCETENPLKIKVEGKPLVIVNEIHGIVDGKCHYTSSVSDGGGTECYFTDEMRNVVAQSSRDLLSGGKVKTETRVSSEGTVESVITIDGKEVKYIIDGKEVSNPMQEALDNGQCVIFGY